MSTVKVLLYDLSQGMARMLSAQMVGKQIDGIWHTSTVVYGKEFFFGQGILECRPYQSGHGNPVQEFDMGITEIPETLFREHLSSLKSHWTASSYHLLDNNCNNFTNELCNFLTGQSIPSWITGLPAEFLETPLGRQFRPMIDAMFGGGGPSQWNDMERTVEKPSPSLADVTTKQQLDQILSNPAVVVMFTSSTCPPCKMIEPHYSKLIEEINRDYVPSGAPRRHQNWITGVKVNLSTSNSVAQAYQVTVTPTWMLFKNGEPFYEFKGADRGELETSVRSLVHQVWPRHKHASLNLSHISNMGSQLFTYPLPDIVKVQQKLEQFKPGVSVEWSNLPKVLDSLPVEQAFPVLDLIRHHVASTPASQSDLKDNQHVFDAFARYASGAPKPTLLTSLKLACQLPPSVLLSESRRSITTSLLIESLLTQDNQIRQAGSSLAWNISLAEAANKHGSHVQWKQDLDVASGPNHDEWVVEIVSALTQGLQNEQDSEVALRLLSALVNFVKFSSNETIELVQVLGFETNPDWIKEKNSRSEKISGLVKDIHLMLK